MDNNLNVMYLTDNNYAIFAGVSILSLFENNKSFDEINVYVIDDSISQENKSIYLGIAQKYNRNIIFLDLSEGIRILKEMHAPTYRNSYTTYLKLFAFNLLPENVHRIFFIDSDSVIVGNLGNIMNIDLNGNMIGAVKDGIVHSYKVALGYSPNDSWYNMGIMLVDVDMWKAQDAQGKVVNQLKKRNAYIAVDQDILNITQHNSIMPIDAKYNAMPHHYVYSYDAFMKAFPQGGFYTKEEIESSQQNAIVRHFERFIGEGPWHKNTVHPYTQLFDYYLAMSPWKNYEKKKANTNLTLKIEKILYKIFPHDVFVYIWAMGFNHYLKQRNDEYKNNTNVKNVC